MAGKKKKYIYYYIQGVLYSKQRRKIVYILYIICVYIGTTGDRLYCDDDDDR